MSKYAEQTYINTSSGCILIDTQVTRSFQESILDPSAPILNYLHSMALMNDGEILEAWRTNDEWRSQLVSEITRQVSKNADLEPFEQILAPISRVLDPKEVISLYRSIQESRRPDFEWRGQFLKIFSELKEADLPQPTISEDESISAAEKARLDQGGETGNHTGEIPF